MKPSWAGDEIDAGVRLPAAPSRRDRCCRKPGGELGRAPPSPFQNRRTLSRYLPFHSVQSTRKVADLVSALADVPGFGDQLHLGEHRVLVNHVEEGAEPIDVVQLAGEGAGQIEAEPVDVHLRHPVPELVHDELEHARMLHVEAYCRSR